MTPQEALIYLDDPSCRHQIGPNKADQLIEVIQGLLDALDQHGHIVDIGEDRFGLEHPVECRKAGLLNCLVDKALTELESRPRPVGRYPVELKDGELRFGEKIETGSVTLKSGFKAVMFEPGFLSFVLGLLAGIPWGIWSALHAQDRGWIR